MNETIEKEKIAIENMIYVSQENKGKSQILFYNKNNTCNMYCFNDNDTFKLDYSNSESLITLPFIYLSKNKENTSYCDLYSINGQPRRIISRFYVIQMKWAMKIGIYKLFLKMLFCEGKF